LVSGFLSGIGVFIFLQLSVSSMNMDVGSFGMFLLSFIAVPIGFAIINFIVGILSGLIFNLSLRLIKGLDCIIEELE